MQLTAADYFALEQAVAADSLSEFVQMAWHVVDPAEPYKHGWHMDAMCEHLEACADGEINRLLINVPPGTSKSTSSCVFFPAWLWGPKERPDYRFIGASFSVQNANRDSRKTRNLVTSDWYQARWPVKLRKDQNEKINFETTSTGFRQAKAVTGMTGERGHCVVWDDPINPEEANSPLRH